MDVPILDIVLLFFALFVFGFILALPMYKFSVKAFVSSALFKKMAAWIPIFAIFLLYVYGPLALKLAIIVYIFYVAVKELVIVRKQHNVDAVVVAYHIGFIVLFSHLLLISDELLLVTICIASVLSDVTAFFFGRYFGKHKLPKRINPNKSWEGIFGQLLGAFIGVVLVNQFILSVPNMYVFLVIGIGSAIGDVLNSSMKRHVGIKDWGDSIPGHGGYLDRFASLAIAIAGTYYFVLLIG